MLGMCRPIISLNIIFLEPYQKSENYGSRSKQWWKRATGSKRVRGLHTTANVHGFTYFSELSISAALQ